jgi:D-proline reductase (dithiol) PrdB
MARLESFDLAEQKRLRELPCPAFTTSPWVTGPPLNKRRVAIVSTAGLHRREDRPFTSDPGDIYRIIPSGVKAEDLVMSHVSVNFDRSGFERDWNLVFPLDRLNEMVKDGTIGSVASYHYSFMGAVDPAQWEKEAKKLARILKNDGVNAVLLIPV